MVWIRLFLALLTALSAAAESASLRGRVSDESGAVIPGASVVIAGPAGRKAAVKAASDGSYMLTGLAAGVYKVVAAAPDLVMPEPATVELRRGVQNLDLVLRVAATIQQLTVKELQQQSLSTEASANASAMVISGDDLQSLADNPEDLQADLLALAGPSAGPNGGEIFVDGFSGGQLPPKESIREIRINQNPFSPEYDKLGFGRIEILTKPGADKFKGTAFYNIGVDALNSRNPYAAQKAPFFLQEYGINLSGPLTRRSSFTVDLQRHPIDNGAVVNAVTLDPVTLDVVSPYTDVFRVKQRRLLFTPRLDYALSANHTLSVRYTYANVDIPGAGIGGGNLAGRGYDSTAEGNGVQVSETAVLSASAVNETRFQYFRSFGADRAFGSGPAIQVLGAFGGGASSFGYGHITRNNYELQNITSKLYRRHTFRFGVRLRVLAVEDVSPTNYAGTFTFGGAPGITSIEQYRRTLLYQRQDLGAAQIRRLGGGATQFTLAAGDPALGASQTDAGVFFGDDWRVRPNLTVSLGVRYEAQNHVHDRRDLAPRIGLAWAPGDRTGKSKPATVVRAGIGVFYDRFAIGNTLDALRYDGVLVQQYVVANPDFFPTVPAPSALSGAQAARTIQRVSGSLRAPYILQSAVGIERQLPGNTSVAVTYANTHGLHQYRSAALPGPVFLMESSGLYNQNQLLTNVSSRVRANVSLFGSYVVSRARSNTDGIGTFPANPASSAGEYGPASTDIHNRASLGGSISAPWNVRLSPLLTVESGPPFDITVGRDLYGTTLLNGRPGITTDPTRPGVIATAYGLLDPNPAPGEPLLPRNYGRGPGAVLLNLRLAKTVAFGPRGEGHAGAANLPGGLGQRQGPASALGLGATTTSAATTVNRRYNLVLSLAVRNVLNHNNPGAIIGNITSSRFGQANQSAGTGGSGLSESANNRRLEWQIRLTF